MAVETYRNPATNEVTRVYDTALTHRKHIVLPEGPAVFRDHMEAEHNGAPIQKAFLYLPDTQETPQASIVPFVGMGGVMTVGGDYAKTAIAMAQEGHMYVTHNPLRNLSVMKQLFDSETRNQPFRFTADVGQKVILATLLHLYRDLDIDTNEVDLTCHSYGGMTGSKLASFDPHVRSVILQDVAGIIEGSLKAHIKGIRGIASEAYDTFRYIKDSIDEVTPDLFTDHKNHVLDNPLLAGREFHALLTDPDLSEDIYTARENGVKVAGVLFAQSAFFALDSVQKFALQKNIFDESVVVDDARHVEANVNPRGNALLQIELVKRLHTLQQAA